jgi:hypothetical protein
VSELPHLERLLLEAAHRRYGRRRWPRRLAIAAAAAMAVIVAAALLSAGPEPSDERAVTRPADDWTTTVNEAHGFTVALPPGWRLATESLTPALSDPREILSAGTFPLAYRPSACNHMPTGALRAIGPGDGFVTVEERGRGGSTVGFPARPASFGGTAEQRSGDVAACLGDGSRAHEYWIPFRDAGRRFYALVVLGPRASRQTKEEAFAILDRLRFERVQPSWRSTP